MRGFLYVSGLLAGGILLAFVLALVNAKEPVDHLPPQLREGAELTGVAAQQAYAAWMVALPTEPALPARLQVELSGHGSASSDGGASSSLACSLELTLEDPRHGRIEAKLRVLEPGRPDIEGAGALLADGSTIWLWGGLAGVAGEAKREGAISLKQALVEDAWSSLRARFPDLLRLAGVGGWSQTIAAPNSVLLLLHPTGLSRGLGALSCASLRLEGKALIARFEPEPESELSGLAILATLDANTGLPTQIEFSQSGASPGGFGELLLRVAQLDEKTANASLLPPADLKFTDMSPMAQMGMAALNAALKGIGGPSDTDF